jgi:hypothetical protein
VNVCRAQVVAAFVKQLGAYVVSEERTMPWDVGEGPGATSIADEVWCWRAGLTNRKGGDPSEWPADLNVRQFPKAS